MRPLGTAPSGMSLFRKAWGHCISGRGTPGRVSAFSFCLLFLRTGGVACRHGGLLQQVPSFDPVFFDLQYSGYKQDAEDDGEQECRHDAPVA